MPSRILRDCTDSEAVNKLSWQAEVFFYRLMMVADDYGSFYANPKLVKTKLFPLKSDSIRDADITRWISECLKSGLLVVYTSSQKEYLRIIKFNQRLRNMRNKFPDPPADISPQLAATRSESPPDIETETETETETEESVLTSVLHARKKISEISKIVSPLPDLVNSNLYRQPIIPTKNQVWEVFAQQNVTKQMAKSFYEKYEATAWFLNGSPIKNWKALASRFITNWKKNDGESENLNGMVL